MQETHSVQVKALWSYPVKSMRGMALERTVMGVTGLPNDRQYMVVTPSGDFVSQRQFPRMAVITPTLTETHLSLSVDGAVMVRVALHEALKAGKKHELKVFKSICYGIEMGSEVSDWLTHFLGEAPGGGALRLMCFDPATRRPVSQKHLKGEDSHTFFADGYPYLLVSEATLNHVNAVLAEKGDESVAMSRFRPNIVVDGTSAFDEFEWDEAIVTTSDARLGLRKPCQRCEIVTVDQSLGRIPTKGQPLATLVKINPLKSRGKKGAYFGMNATLLAGAGQPLAVGDAVRVTRRVASI